MAEKDKSSQAAVVVSVGAAVAAAFALLQKRAQAAPPGPGQILSLDEATMNLLIAIAQTSGNIDSNTLGALAKLQGIIDKIAAGGPGGQGWPPNADTTRITRVGIGALSTAYQLPDISIPDGFTLLVKAWPTNVGIIYVGRSISDATNINQVWPLIPNDFLGVAIKNANALYVSGTVVGDFVGVLIEQRGGG